MPNAFVASRLPPELPPDRTPESFIGSFSFPAGLPLPPFFLHPHLECLFCGETNCILEILWTLPALLMLPEDRERLGRVVGCDADKWIVIIDPIPDGMRAFGCDACGVSLYVPTGYGTVGT